MDVLDKFNTLFISCFDFIQKYYLFGCVLSFILMLIFIKQDYKKFKLIDLVYIFVFSLSSWFAVLALSIILILSLF